ncbi:MAG: hypothetical protein ACOCG5_06335 [Candidatus Alkaliphilus sp. MAG34]|nr:hypothetical protein [Clostridiales bacterium]
MINIDPSDCVKNVILSEAKDLKWLKNEILRYTQNDKKREKCFFTQSAVVGTVCTFHFRMTKM